MEKWANKDALLGLKLPKERYSIDGIGDVWIHGLAIGAKDDYEDAVVSVTAGSRHVSIKNARAILVIRCLYDQHGRRIFGDGDLGKVCEMPAAIIEPIYEIARRLSGMPTGEIEQMVKNSGAIAGPDFDTD